MTQESLHICHLLLTDRFAGSERYAIELANEQSRCHRVSLVIPATAAEARVDALRHRLLPAVEVHLVPGWRLLQSTRAQRIVRALNPDVAHGHLSQGCKALRALGLSSTLRIGTLHIRYKPQQHSFLDGLIAIAPWQMPALPTRLLEHSVQIDNWCAPFQFDPEARQRLRAALNIDENTWLVGTLGRVEKSKGHDILVKAWRRSRLPNARLAIVGNGRDWQAVRSAAPSEVIMPGFTDRPEDWLSAFDLFVSCAHSEPFGLVFLEAMRCGLPVLASRSEGAKHLSALIDRPLLPLGDVDALQHALSAVLKQRPRRGHYDLRNFEISRKTAEIEAFYRKLLQDLIPTKG